MTHADDPMRESEAEGRALETAVRFLEANREGVLAFGDTLVKVKLVADPAGGRLLASVPVATFFESEHILWVPEETDDAMQLLVSPEETGESVTSDRWLAFHGEPEHVRWAWLWIDSAKHGPWVFDGDVMVPANSVAEVESELVRRFNADKAELAAIAERATGTSVADPLCVGVDQHGMYVRARFGVLRIEWDRELDGEDAARGHVVKLIEEHKQ